MHQIVPQDEKKQQKKNKTDLSLTASEQVFASSVLMRYSPVPSWRQQRDIITNRSHAGHMTSPDVLQATPLLRREGVQSAQQPQPNMAA